MPNILVIGDCILDKYIHGTATRLSPEAPVPVINFESEESRLGGAGNVAANIKSLGGRPFMISICGNDAERIELHDAFSSKDIYERQLTVCYNRRTSVKTRLIVNKQQIARLDREDTKQLCGVMTQDVMRAVDRHLEHWVTSAIVVSDYAKGLISSRLMYHLASKGLPLFVDPKVSNWRAYIDLAAAIQVITPNLHEAEGLTGLKASDGIDFIGRKLIEKFACHYALITRGEDGMSLYAANDKDSKGLHIPTAARAVYDVSGAGDTVIAALALAYSSGLSMQESAIFANRAAGIAVGKAGTATVTKEEMENTCQEVAGL